MKYCRCRAEKLISNMSCKLPVVFDVVDCWNQDKGIKLLFHKILDQFAYYDELSASFASTIEHVYMYVCA